MEMDKRLRSIVDNFENMRIGLDDSFRFNCKMCGKCCIHREDVLLNPFDIYRMSEALGKEPSDVFVEYCEAYLGRSSKMVVVRLKPVGSAMRCPFLRDRKCAIHKNKPTVCALYPLGRALEAEKKDADSNVDIMSCGVQYILQTPMCNDKSETHTVREWLNDFNLAEQDAFFKTWMQLVVDCGKVVRAFEEQERIETADIFLTFVLRVMYLQYNTAEAFMPQFERNVSVCREVCSTAWAEIQRKKES